MKDLRYQKEQERNFVGLSLATFVDYYNQNTPASFPRASVKALEEFQDAHPSLFNNTKEWTIDKHRKRLMDWLSSTQARV